MSCPLSLEEEEKMLASIPEKAVDQAVREISKAQRLRIDTLLSAQTQATKSTAELVLA